jgi:hypothetical protein
VANAIGIESDIISKSDAVLAIVSFVTTVSSVSRASCSDRVRVVAILSWVCSESDGDSVIVIVLDRESVAPIESPADIPNDIPIASVAANESDKVAEPAYNIDPESMTASVS